MKLFQDSQEAVNANNIESKVLSKFCYVEVKLESTDEEQFESITLIPYTQQGVTVLTWNGPKIFKLEKVDDFDGPNWFAAGKKILVNYNISAQVFWNGY